MSIIDLIDHTISEGNRLFADTRFRDTWLIYHDALPQWWESAAQEYIASLGFGDRQWRARGATNELVASHYRHRLMGDSPELMPLDSSLFGDLIQKVAWLVVSTKEETSNAKYSMATPDATWQTMVDAWEFIPEARILQDIGRFRSALEAIIAADGCYVKELDLRNGHRKVMQRVVRGRALRDGNNEGKAATTATVEKAIRDAAASWKGISAKIKV